MNIYLTLLVHNILFVNSHIFYNFFYGVTRDFLVFVIKQCLVRHRDVQIFKVCILVVRNVNPGIFWDCFQLLLIPKLHWLAEVLSSNS